MRFLESPYRFILVAAFSGLPVHAEARAQGPAPGRPVSLHPDNPRYFLFRGKPLVLVTASEHYGSVINRPFDFRKYLDDAADNKMTLTRAFLLYRELQTPRNPSSPCKPESPDYLAPYPRIGPGKAIDGEPVYDLDQWNAEYFHRLRRFLRCASRRGIVVELTLFSHLYKDELWGLNPLRQKNNKQKGGKGEWFEYVTLRDRALSRRQAAYARKIVRETCGFDNVYYEICNEPAGGRPKKGSDPLKKRGQTPFPGVAEVDAWLAEMTRTVRDELKKRGRQHLVFGAQAFDAGRLRQDFEATFAGTAWDAVNVHPHQYLFWKRQKYHMGNFMTKDLTLGPVRDFCRVVSAQSKPVVLDEDNAASLYRDPVGWTIHRKRAWTAVLSGAHYDYIDFSVTVGSEAGTAASRRAIRRWMKHLSEFIHGFDFIHARPGPAWVGHLPKEVVASTLVAEGKDYAAYLADAREVTDPDAGKPLEGKVLLTLPKGSFRVRLYSPVTGEYSPAVIVEGGKPAALELAPFREDIVIRATRKEK
jgi:hypothetical protein